jgi:hypothetical protein
LLTRLLSYRMKPAGTKHTHGFADTGPDRGMPVLARHVAAVEPAADVKGPERRSTDQFVGRVEGDAIEAGGMERQGTELGG